MSSYTPGFTSLDYTFITANKEPVFGIGNGGGYDPGALQALLYDPSEPPFARQKGARALVDMSRVAKKNIEKEYTLRSAQLTSEVEDDLSDMRTAANESDTLSPLEKITNEKARVNTLIQEKSKLLNEKQTEANAFFGSDPLTKTEGELNQAFLKNLTISLKEPKYQEWGDSYTAAYSAKAIASTITILNAKSNALAQQQAQETARIAAEAEAQRVAAEAEQARLAAEAEQARLAAEAEAAAYKDAVNFLASTNEQILQKYGANMSKIAQGLQTDISGKKVRSYAEAMATFEKVNANPNIKLNAQDTQAVVNALNALDKATLADNVSRLGKAFGVVGMIVQADTIREKAVSGFQTGDWKPLMLEFESMAVGTLAATAAGAMLAAVLGVLGTPAIIAVPFVAVLMAGVASYIDAEKVDELNRLITK